MYFSLNVVSTLIVLLASLSNDVIMAQIALLAFLACRFNHKETRLVDVCNIALYTQIFMPDLAQHIEIYAWPSLRAARPVHRFTVLCSTVSYTCTAAATVYHSKRLLQSEDVLILCWVTKFAMTFKWQIGRICLRSTAVVLVCRSGTKWAHISCALWIPEVTIDCPDKMEPITNISQIPVSFHTITALYLFPSCQYICISESTSKQFVSNLYRFYLITKNKR